VTLHCGFNLHFPDVEHLFVYLLATFKPSLESCLLKSFARFLMRVFVVFSSVQLYEFLMCFGC
jgi:hypothetical protein